MLNNVTIVRVDWITKDGKHEFQTFDEPKVEEKLKELEAEGATAEVKFTQTFGWRNVSETNPLADVTEFISNPEVQADLINRSLDIKQNQFVRKLMTNDSFTPVEGVYDLTEICSTVPERKGISDDEKAARAFSKLAGRQVSKEEILAIIQAMNAGATASA